MMTDTVFNFRFSCHMQVQRVKVSQQIMPKKNSFFKNNPEPFTSSTYCGDAVCFLTPSSMLSFSLLIIVRKGFYPSRILVVPVVCAVFIGLHCLQYLSILTMLGWGGGHTVAQLVEGLSHKPEICSLDSQWSH